MKNKKVLITGASIAGPTLAYWLHKYGFEVSVAERAAALRLGGQNIDVKGPALEIARKMGLEDRIRDANTTEIGIHFVNTDNKLLAEFPKDSALSMTQDLEILRGDLVNILYEHSRKDVLYLFNDYITQVQESAHDISVTFNSGKTETYDLVISAEGIGSSTRKLVFGEETAFKFLGLYTAYLTIEKTETDSRWARWCNARGGVVYMLRPDNYGSTRASVTFLASEKDYKSRSVAEQKQVLIERMRGTGWESDRLIDEITRTQDLYFDKVSQVKSPRWSKGRVALIGDAAYCATPIAGKGTDLAMSGAYILAGELSIAQTYQEAFDSYEKKMRPYVEKSQKLPPGVPRIVYPTSHLGLFLLNSLFAAVGSSPVKWVIGLFGKGKKKEEVDIDLPNYLQINSNRFIKKES